MTRDPLYSLREVAEMTDTNIFTVRNWVSQRLIPVERIGPTKLKRVRVRRSVLVGLFPHIENLGTLNRSV